MRAVLVPLLRQSNIHHGLPRIKRPPTLACPSRAYTNPSSSQPHVRYITIDNPRKRNALSLPVLESLERQLLGVNPGWPCFGRDWDIPWEGDEMEVERFWEPLNRNVKVVILRSEGESVFSSGHDLNEISTQDSELHARIFDTCNRVMMLIRELPQPIIAQVQGVATAAGCQLVAACDLAVARSLLYHPLHSPLPQSSPETPPPPPPHRRAHFRPRGPLASPSLTHLPQ
ncbi:ClpP/crotonase-like domain-containing protein [Endogone sp. FLAS-F59071]|nr:ClpP/crotonase-like domain-containing protein [Endogone sp. FLAS-F59071]|eukprot:RUS22174.1 ClpP/crotonase-like domain-containing protein [Endogone sp. FLAS-F59071]